MLWLSSAQTQNYCVNSIDELKDKKKKRRRRLQAKSNRYLHIRTECIDFITNCKLVDSIQCRLAKLPNVQFEQRNRIDHRKIYFSAHLAYIAVLALTARFSIVCSISSCLFTILHDFQLNAKDDAIKVAFRIFSKFHQYARGFGFCKSRGDAPNECTYSASQINANQNP